MLTNAVNVSIQQLLRPRFHDSPLFNALETADLSHVPKTRIVAIRAISSVQRKIRCSFIKPLSFSSVFLDLSKTYLLVTRKTVSDVLFPRSDRFTLLIAAFIWALSAICIDMSFKNDFSLCRFLNLQLVASKAPKAFIQVA